MNQNQQLRHDVRKLMTGYSKRHPGDFEAYMAASAVVWLLAGRPGMSQEQRIDHLTSSYQVVVHLASTRDSETLVTALEHSLNLLEAAREHEASTAALTEDFSAWAAELAEPEPEA